MEEKIYKMYTMKNGEITMTEIPLDPEPQKPAIKYIEKYFCPKCDWNLNFTSQDFTKKTPPYRCPRCHQELEWREIQ